MNFSAVLNAFILSELQIYHKGLADRTRLWYYMYDDISENANVKLMSSDFSFI